MLPTPSILDTPQTAGLGELSSGVSPSRQYYRFDDMQGRRKRIFDNVYTAAQNIAPVSNTRHSLGVEDVHWVGPEDFTIAQQKQALLSQDTLARRLTGTYRLRDLEGNLIAERKTQLAKVPYLTNRGTFIMNGNEYTMANQMRLRPGVFTRQKENGELESHVNVSKGYGHRIFLDPATGIFRIKMGQAQIPLYPLLRAMGVSDKQMRDSWGNELTASNMRKNDPQAMRKLYAKLYRNGKHEEGLDEKEAVVKAFNDMTLDPEVTSKTLGKDFSNVGPETLMAITNKLVKINRGEIEADDRDAMPYQQFVGPEDMFSERLSKAKNVLRQLLWKSSPRSNLDGIGSNAYGDTINSALMSSGLGIPIEEVNPAEILDHQSRITRMGEGGIPSLDAVPDEARSVQPSQFGFIDILRTPESGKVGVDARLARAAVRGDDGRLYTPVINRAGKQEYKSPQDLADSVLAFPNSLRSNAPYVAALTGGRLRMVPRDKVDFEIPDMEGTFSNLGNMIPFKSMVKGQRAVMAARMLTQAMPLKGAEAPLVQAGIPGQEGRSFEDEYAKHMGAVRADKNGTVLNVSPNAVQVRYEDGTKDTIDLYENFPFNRKTFYHQQPRVSPGQAFRSGDLLATSNYTNAEGTTALGRNARVAYVPWGGLNFEDAIVISQSFAKKMSSEHMYQNAHEWEAADKRGKNKFMAIFPSAYDKKMLEKFDDKGVIKPGTEVKQGDPLILIARERERNKKSILGGKSSYTNVSQTWDHSHNGIVTDVVHTNKGATVVVKTSMPMGVGDKLSGRYGDKGIIAEVVPDDDMPTLGDGKPSEVLLNPLGVVSRTNPAQIVEAALGKIAEKTGKPFKIADFQDEDDLVEFALKELQKAGIKDTETIIDPRNDRKIDDVLTGNRWFMKLHHTAESKSAGRGLGSYTAEGLPAKGGKQGAKRIGMLETNALLSHGATETLREAGMVRGQSQPQYWAQYMSGFKPPTPRVPFVYDKFVNSLKASGINVVRDGSRTHIMALTDKDIDQLAGDREIRNVETVNWKNMEPVTGGLFDTALTGGHQSSAGGGNRWSFIKLQEPMPNPVMEEPIRRILGLTQKKFEDIIAGKEELNGGRGPKAIAKALESINLDAEIARARADISSGKKTYRDAAVRRLGYLKSAQRLGIHPKDWVLTKAPVLPPAFRPISALGPKKLPLVADPNYLYKELWEANSNLRDMTGEVDDADLGDERLNLYQSFKAVTGLGDPTNPKHQERKVKGILKHVFGSSPKLGIVQRRLLGSTTDLVGRSVIAPDPDLDMDQVGIPENQAWDIYKPIIVRRLVRRGLPRLHAVRAVEERSPHARKELVDEMESGVVVINRAPTLHRYGMMASRPKLVKGDVLKVSPLVVGGFGADFDGDAMQYHVPTTDEAKKEALEKMLPSRNLLSAATFKVMYAPSQEYVGGLYEASAREDNKPTLTFATPADAIRAYKQGRIGVGRRIEILNK